MRTRIVLCTGAFLFCFVMFVLIHGIRSMSVHSSSSLELPGINRTVHASVRKHHPLVSADTPIKVGGGAMTFFSQTDWTPVNNGFCTPLSSSNASTSYLERLFDHGRQQTDSPVDGMAAWRIELRGHSEAEAPVTPGQPVVSTPSDDGVTLQASASSCNGVSGQSISITPIGNGTFYTSTELAPSGKFQHNRRFAVPRCQVDRDRCERMAEARFYDGNGTLTATYKCPDGECRVFVGN